MHEFAKQKRVNFLISNRKSLAPFCFVHIDVWGPINVPDISSAKWFIIFIDDCTRVTSVFPLKHKYDISSAFIQFVTMNKNQFGLKITRIRYDNTREYFNLELTYFFQKEEII